MNKLILCVCLSLGSVYPVYSFAASIQQQQYTNHVSFLSEQGFEWKLNQPIDYKNFYLTAEKDGQQVGLYETRIGQQIGGIYIGQTINDVLKKYGNPLSSIVRNKSKYSKNYLNKYGATTQGIYLIEGRHVHYLYDSHDKNKIRAILSVDKEIYEGTQDNYVTADHNLRDSFEDLMGHLLNQSRVQHGLKPLVIGQKYKSVARRHSQDMATRNYFAHNTPEGISADQRMKAINPFLSAGENISSGYDNPILSHHGLMNSLGHRENILTTSSTHSFTGVAFEKDKSKPMYTINFYKENLNNPIKLASEYGFEWQLSTPVNYEKFYLSAIKDHREVAFFETRSGVQFGGVKIGQTMSDVLKKHGQPISTIQKATGVFSPNYVNSTGNVTHGTYLIDGQYITYLYDVANQQRVRAIFGIDQNLEEDKGAVYNAANIKLRDNAEQLFLHLMNQVRATQKLSPLLMIPQQQQVARQHSQDMVNRNFFDYKSPEGKGTQQRLEAANIPFSSYGSDIYRSSHSTLLMFHRLFSNENSRKRILNNQYTHLLMGMAIEKKSNPSVLTTLNYYRYDENLQDKDHKRFASGYDFNWQLPPSVNEKNFYLIGKKFDRQVALYETRQGKTVEGIQVGQKYADVVRKHGQPVEYITKNNKRYKQGYGEAGNITHGTYLINGRYITYLYDTQQAQRIYAIFSIDEEMEASMPGYYVKSSTGLAQGYEDLLVHLMNQGRATQQLPPLVAAPKYNGLVRQHSTDMLTRNFYSVSNPDKMSIKDRVEQGGIPQLGVAQAVLQGAQTPIVMYQRILNTPDHRKNLYHPDYTHVLVGVDFKKTDQPAAALSLAYYQAVQP